MEGLLLNEKAYNEDKEAHYHTDESDFSNEWHSRSFLVNGYVDIGMVIKCPMSHDPSECCCIPHEFGYEPLSWEIVEQYWLDSWIEEDEAEKEEALQRECDQFEEEKRRQDRCFLSIPYEYLNYGYVWIEGDT
eukprot:758271_1